MVGSDENFLGVMRPSNQGDLRAVGGKINVGIGQTRRALSAINENIHGAPPFPSEVHKRGALTKKFSAQNAAKKQHQQLVQEPKPIFPSVVSANASDGYIIINVEDDDDDNYKTDGDYPIPMSVQHTEAFLDEIDRLDAEVEMEDVDEEPVLDIDNCDKEDPLAVVEYIHDIYAYYKRTESSSYAHPDYMQHQSDINEKMRAIVIDWLIEVHYKFELMDETLYLTINLIDRFLAKQPIARKKLQLVGVTAMLIACKYEEVSVPIVDDFIFISDNAYTRKEVLDMESLMINTLQFNLSTPTPYVFMKRFLKAAESDKQLEHMSFFMIELCLIEYEMLKFSPSLLAAAAIFTAQCCRCGAKYWSKTCEKYTTYTQDQLLVCSKLMVSFHQKAETGELTGVHRKYSLYKYGYAAKSKPAVFLLDAAKP